MNEENAPTNQAVPDPSHRPHEWPQADENWCSCCRESIVDGMHNVIRIQTTPEKQLSEKGEVLGEENRKAKYKAYLHAKCWRIHFGQRVECDKCGGFSRHTVLQDGSVNPCWCTCHKGSNHCSYVIDPNTIDKLKTGKRKKHGIG